MTARSRRQALKTAGGRVRLPRPGRHARPDPQAAPARPAGARPAGAEAAALPGQGQADHLPVHAGAISQMDTFEYKPQLQKDDGKAGPGGGTLDRVEVQVPPARPDRAPGSPSCSRTWPGTRTSSASSAACTPTRRPTRRRSSSCTPARALASLTRPSMGAWLLYGLGTENQDLPGYVTINPPPNFGGAVNYGSAFLPAHFQGTRINDTGYLPNLKAADAAAAAAQAARPDPVDEPRPGRRARRAGRGRRHDPVVTSWPSGCRARCRSCSTSRRSRRRCSTPTA